MGAKQTCPALRLQEAGSGTSAYGGAYVESGASPRAIFNLPIIMQTSVAKAGTQIACFEADRAQAKISLALERCHLPRNFLPFQEEAWSCSGELRDDGSLLRCRLCRVLCKGLWAGGLKEGSVAANRPAFEANFSRFNRRGECAAELCRPEDTFALDDRSPRLPRGLLSDARTCCGHRQSCSGWDRRPDRSG